MTKTMTMELIEDNVISHEAIEDNEQMDELIKKLYNKYMIQDLVIPYDVEDIKQAFENLCSKKDGMKRKMKNANGENSFKISDNVGVKTVHLVYVNEKFTRVVYYMWVGRSPSSRSSNGVDIGTVTKRNLNNLAQDLLNELKIIASDNDESMAKGIPSDKIIASSTVGSGNEQIVEEIEDNENDVSEKIHLDDETGVVKEEVKPKTGEVIDVGAAEVIEDPHGELEDIVNSSDDVLEASNIKDSKKKSSDNTLIWCCIGLFIFFAICATAAMTIMFLD